jgi:hypothetical protein
VAKFTSSNGDSGTVAFLTYASDDGAEITLVHVFPASCAMGRQTEGVAERSRQAFEFIASAGLEIYGTPSAGTLQMIAGCGVRVTVRPRSVGGYLRLAGG